LEQTISVWKDRVPVIVALSNPHIQAHHWVSLFQTIGVKEYPTASASGIGFSIGLLEMLGVFNRAELVPDWSRRASGEYDLNSKIDRIETDWRDLEFNVKNYKESSDMFILGSLEAIMTQIENDQKTLMNVQMSQYITPLVQPRVKEWEAKLTMVSEVIEEWLAFQKTWIFLEILYNRNNTLNIGEDVFIKLSATEDGDDFGMIDSYFREIMYRTNLNKNVLACTLEETRLNELVRYNAWLEHVANKIPSYHNEEYDDSAILPPPPTYEQLVAEEEKAKKQLEEAAEIAGGDEEELPEILDEKDDENDDEPVETPREIREEIEREEARELEEEEPMEPTTAMTNFSSDELILN
jgi:dynein heavy chain